MIQIVEVGARDGLQNESKMLSVEQKLEMIRRLVQAGTRRIEVGAFVSPQWVPQMKDSAQLIRLLREDAFLGQPKVFNRFSVLVPNIKGMEDAIASGIREVAIFGSCSEAFAKKNMNCTIAESFVRFEGVMALAKKAKIPVRGYLSMAFGCPFEGRVSEAQVVRLAKRMKALNVREISIGDTIGVANPRQVQSLLRKLKKAVGTQMLALHFHDTRGTALANALMGLQQGIQVFDASIGGLGGCPYAGGATGNLATEDLQYMLHGMGLKTGLNLDQLKAIAKWLEGLFGKRMASKLSQIP
jgi:hydroxymethylglutaryl-CoA lyase